MFKYIVTSSKSFSMLLNIQALIEASFAGNLSWIKSYIIQRTIAHVMALMSLPFFFFDSNKCLDFFAVFPQAQGSEEPPFLRVGTEVSAKYRGAFCEASIKTVKKHVKCKVSIIDVFSTSL